MKIARSIGCDIEVMEAEDFTATSFAPFIAGRRPLLVRGLAAVAAPKLVQVRKRPCLLVAFLMFVPNVSWQSIVVI